jgi:hypothetical protein
MSTAILARSSSALLPAEVVPNVESHGGHCSSEGCSRQQHRQRRCVVAHGYATDVSRDSVLAMLGASAGIGGLTLVFLGVIVSTYQSYGAASSPSVLGRYRRSAAFVLASFSLSLVTVILSVAWLTWSHPVGALFWAIVAVFLVQVGALFATALFVSLQVLWR